MAAAETATGHLAASGSIALADGRSLSYLAAGPPDGFPVLYLHGAIGSPLRRSAPLDRVIRRHRLRYLMVDRPGFGGSDHAPCRRVIDFAADIGELADELDFERFSVVGVSAGAPYALACGAALPERLHGVAAVSCTGPGLAPHQAPGMALRYRIALAALASHPRPAAGLGDRAMRLLRRRPELLAALLALGGSRSESEQLEDAAARLTAVRSLLGATEGGVGVMIDDYLVGCRPWGFDPEAIDARVRIWHGARDRVVPVAQARALAARIPGCRVSIDPDEGHFFFRRRLGSILGPLAPPRPGVRAAA